MGYKRDGKKLLHNDTKWKEWREENADLIEASGLPDLVVSDAHHWYHFLDHRCLDDDPLSFELNDLTVRQKAFLLQLVATEVGGVNSLTGGILVAHLISAVKERYRE